LFQKLVGILDIFTVLKFIAFILALFVLSCSSIPCCAMDTYNSGIAKEKHPQEKDNDCNGNCSPFFACGTCSGFSADVQEFRIKPVLAMERASYSDFYICSHSEYFPYYWQPPKIS
jgi:hypothetical protein